MIRIPLIARDQSLSFIISRWGLGNRVIPVGCALSLAKELNYRLVVYWPANMAFGNTRFNVRFDDLFDTTGLPFELVEGYEARIMRAVGSTLLWKDTPLLKIPLKFIGFQYDRAIQYSKYGKHITIDSWFKRSSVTDLRPYHKILLSTPRFFGRSCDVSWLKPAPHIAPRIAELKKKFAQNTIGVHIRGTDMVHRPEIEKIVSRMRAEVELDPKVKFFLASDGDESEKIISDAFGDKLIRTTPSIVSERNTVQGQQDAVVDLFGLASTSRIIGTWPSTFLVLAAMIGNKPMTRAHPQNFTYIKGGLI